MTKNDTAAKWLSRMGGESPSEAFAADLFKKWHQCHTPQWRTLMQTGYVSTEVKGLANLGCLLAVHSVNVYNVESEKNAIQIKYMSSGPSTERLVILQAAEQRQIPSDWISASGGRGLDVWYELAPSVVVKSHVELLKDNSIMRQQLNERGSKAWLQHVVQRRIEKDFQFFLQFQIGPQTLKVSIDGKTLDEDPSYAELHRMSREPAPTGDVDSNYTQRLPKAFVAHVFERSVDWLREQIDNGAIRVHSNTNRTAKSARFHVDTVPQLKQPDERARLLAEFQKSNQKQKPTNSRRKTD